MDKENIVVDLFGKAGNIKSRHDYVRWLKETANNKSTHSVLRKMVRDLLDSEACHMISNLWLRLMCIHIWRLGESGMEYFRQTVARNYGISSRNNISQLDGEFSRKLMAMTALPSLNVNIDSLMLKHELFSMDESYVYNTITKLLYTLVQEKNLGKWIPEAGESGVGKPPVINIDDMPISQDILNSTFDLEAMSQGCELGEMGCVMEMGAGHGRLAYSFLKHFSHTKYIIVDIPPALFVSYWYLSKVFPNKRLLYLGNTEQIENFHNNMEGNDILFLMPHQLKYLRSEKICDLFIAVNCLQEIETDILDEYFDFINRAASNCYFKALDVPANGYDDNFCDFEDYPVKENWEQVFDRRCEFPDFYRESFYKIRCLCNEC